MRAPPGDHCSSWFLALPLSAFPFHRSGNQGSGELSSLLAPLGSSGETMMKKHLFSFNMDGLSVAFVHIAKEEFSAILSLWPERQSKAERP